jgi:spore maturation protein SpmA
MVLNYVWISFFVIAFVVAMYKCIVNGDMAIINTLGTDVFDAAKNTIIDVAIPLAGAMIFFLGLMNIAKEAGAINFLARLLNPFLKRLFPEIPDKHPVMGEMVMNFSANMLGLDNAATPFGLKAMKSLEDLNPEKGTATNAQIMFLVLHTSGLTLIPLSILGYRIAAGSKEVASIFIPCVLATVVATVASIFIVGIKQRIKFDHVFWSWILGLLLFVMVVLGSINSLSEETKNIVANFAGNFIILLLIVSILLGGFFKKLNVFDTFIEGAKEGWEVVVKVMPYLVGMLVGIKLFRDCGALGYVVDAISFVISKIGINTDFVDALPVAIMKPFSGGGARGLLLDIYKNPAFGPDSFVGKMASIFQGSADTTFYIIALYFGSVGIKKVRYSIWAGMLADLLGVIAAIFIGYLFFHH